MSTGVFREHVATVASIDRYDSEGPTHMGASYKSNHGKVQVVKYDFAVQGGAQGDISLDLPYPIPSGSIVYASMVKPGATYASAGASTVSIGVDAAGDMSSSALSIAQVNAGFREPRNAAVSPVVTTAERKVVLVTIAAADATAGSFDVYLEYYEP